MMSKSIKLFEVTLLWGEKADVVKRTPSCESNGFFANVRWSVEQAERYLDGFALDGPDNRMAAAFFCDNPHLSSERSKRVSLRIAVEMALPVIGIDGERVMDATPQEFGSKEALHSYLDGRTAQSAIVNGFDIAILYPALADERAKRFSRWRHTAPFPDPSPLRSTRTLGFARNWHDPR
jgi:hypothetical protein